MDENSKNFEEGKKIWDACAWPMAEVMILNKVEGMAKSLQPSNSNAHEKCVDAKDYEGCIRVNSSLSTAAPSNKCKADEWCIADEGVDIFGMQKIEGWQMRTNHAKRTVGYRKPEIYKVNVRGKTNRYIVRESVVRYYVSATAAIPESTTSFGSAQTNCSSYGSVINCTTTPAPTVTSPGIPGRTGGVEQMEVHEVIDCKEKTLGIHVDGELRGRWTALAKREIKEIEEKYCPIVDSLEVSSFGKYAKI